MNKFYNNHPKILELEKAVLLYPEDIEARLIYAEALEEFHIPHKYPGLERAEFIRAQIELAKHGKPRKRYGEHQVDTFSIRRGLGSCYVEGIPEPLEIGERVDLTLTEVESNAEHPGTVNEIPRSQRLKTFWPGVLVTQVRPMALSVHRLHRYEIEFKIDELSRAWPGDSLREKALELFRLGDGRGDLPLPYQGKDANVSSGLHTNPYDSVHPFTTEIWPSQPGGSQRAKFPRWRFVWRNGFPDHVESSADDWLEYGPYIVSHSPIVRCSNPVSELIGLDGVRRQAKLDLPCPFCEGKGTTLGAGPDRGNPKCTDCKGQGWIVNRNWIRSEE